MQFVKDIGKARVERVDLDRIEDFSHLSIAGDLVDAVEILQRRIILAFLEGQERGIEESLRENRARENSASENMAKAAIKESTIE